MMEPISATAPLAGTSLFDIDPAVVPDFLRKAKGYTTPAAVTPTERPTTPIREEAPARPEVKQERPVTEQHLPAGAATDDRKVDPVDTHEVEAVDTKDDELERLLRQQQEIQRQIEERKIQRKQLVINEIMNVMESENVSIEELIDALGGIKIKRKGVKAQIKYRDPETGATWSGRGKEPAWIKGKDRSLFEIKD